MIKKCQRVRKYVLSKEKIRKETLEFLNLADKFDGRYLGLTFMYLQQPHFVRILVKKVYKKYMFCITE